MAGRYERFFLHPTLSQAARRFLFDERRLDPRVVRWCRLTSWQDRQGVEWLQIPYYDLHGSLIGVQNRRLSQAPGGAASDSDGDSDGDGGLPRFRFPKGSRCSIYNLPVLGRLHAGDELWITEGCSDCWAMLSSGRKAIAIPSATLLSPHDKELLRRLAQTQTETKTKTKTQTKTQTETQTETKTKTETKTETQTKTQTETKTETETGLTFHMCPDQDVPGERLFLQLREVIPMLRHHPLPKGCKDYGEYYKVNHENLNENEP